MGLTYTERMIVAKYLSSNPPPKAKEIARELGVSVKTVYKALYKYRKLRGAEEALSAAPADPGPRSHGGGPDIEALLRALLELKASIDRLNDSINRLVQALSSQPSRAEEGDQLADLPSFITGNPWLELIGKLSNG